MRKSLIFLLLASALTPAAAYAQDEGPGRGSRAEGERSERSGQRDSGKNARPPRSERMERSEPAARVDRAERTDRSADRTPRINPSKDLERAARSDRMQRAERPVREERLQANDPQPVEQVQAPVAVQPVQQSNRRSDSLVDGFRQVARDNASDRDDHDRDHDHEWSKDWRKDKRYDWWKHRNHYRSLFRLGHYYDPYGWGYRRWSIGYSLWPSYYGSNYWLNDPWMYRLPQAYGPYRWVRYYDDALLVNIYTGHVVDVIYNFFW